jgi:DNA repair protein RadC
VLEQQLIELVGLPRKKADVIGQVLRDNGVQYSRNVTPEQWVAQYSITASQSKKLVQALAFSEIPNVEFSLQVMSPATAFHHLISKTRHLTIETFGVLIMNTKNKVLLEKVLYSGSANSALLRVAECFRDAILVNGVGVLFYHNHPSGDPTPSSDDITTTRSLVEAGKLLDIDVLDHVILGHTNYVSLREQRLM